MNNRQIWDSLNEITCLDYYKENIEENFETYPSYYEVYKNYSFTDKYKVQITDVESKTKFVMQKKIVMHPNQTIVQGEYVHWKSQDDTWIVLKHDNQYEFQNVGFMINCNARLKWKDEVGDIFEYACLIDVDGIYGSSYSEINEMLFVDKRTKIYFQFNENTSKIKPNTRMIINNKAIKMRYVDNYRFNEYRTLLVFDFDEEELDERDDLVNGIAWNPWMADIPIESEPIVGVDISLINYKNSVIDNINKTITLFKEFGDTYEIQAQDINGEIVVDATFTILIIQGAEIFTINQNGKEFTLTPSGEGNAIIRIIDNLSLDEEDFNVNIKSWY